MFSFLKCVFLSGNNSLSFTVFSAGWNARTPSSATSESRVGLRDGVLRRRNVGCGLTSGSRSRSSGRSRSRPRRSSWASSCADRERRRRLRTWRPGGRECLRRKMRGWFYNSVKPQKTNLGWKLKDCSCRLLQLISRYISWVPNSNNSAHHLGINFRAV